MPRKKKPVEQDTEWIDDATRMALLREGVVVIGSMVHRNVRRLEVVSPRHDALARTQQAVGPDVEVDLLGDTPRFIGPIRCTGHMEREPRLLQLRITVGTNQHIGEILHLEDDELVVVYATACYPASFDLGERWDCPHHIHLDRPLGDRIVIDGTSGEQVPYRDVYAEMEARDAA